MAVSFGQDAFISFGRALLPGTLWLLLSVATLPVAAVASAMTINPASAEQAIVQWKHAAMSRLASFKMAAVSPLRSLRDVVGDIPPPYLAAMLSTCCLVPLLFVRRRSGRQKSQRVAADDVSDTVGVGEYWTVFLVDMTDIPSDAKATDPGLLKKHSTYESYYVPRTGFTYPSIRTFYRPHPQGSKLPTSPPIPLLVFIHGLGGSVAQFHPLFNSLVNVAPCLSIDFPGCGLSSFAPKDWAAYTTDALVHLLAVAIETHRDASADQQVVLIGHSMGASLAALLASKTSPHAGLLSEHVAGLIGICPKADPPSASSAPGLRMLRFVPGAVVDVLRWWDRRGGTRSGSVTRFTGPDAERETRKLQVKFNEQSRTPVFRRMAIGAIPFYDDTGEPRNGLPGRTVWAGLDLPTLLIAGASDAVTPPTEIEKIAGFLGKAVSAKKEKSALVPDAAAPVDTSPLNRESSKDNHPDESLSLLNGGTEDPQAHSLGSITTTREDSAPGPAPPAPRHLVLKTTVLPPPAAHALLFAPASSRTIAGLIQTFLADHIDKRLSLGWQLQFLTTEGKWDVKNLQKWRGVVPVSAPIANVFRAMKTLREVDETHSPPVFVEHWRDKIKAVVDISHESPVYDPRGLEKGGVEYYKFPTVSKLPPTVDEVKNFIDLVDQLRGLQVQPRPGDDDHDAAAEKKYRKQYGDSGVGANGRAGAGNDTGDQRLIGVHCHYGYNRTGFFIVCYLVERLGYRLPDAIAEFQDKRPPGIRHEHFIDTLYVRYCVGLKRAPTL